MERLKPAEILLIEDNICDVEIAKEALLKCKFKNNLHVVMNGRDALDFLFKRGRFSEAITPELILLDLNLPDIDGRDILNEIKNNNKLKAIPVVVLTSSRAEEDIIRAYTSHANCYVTKPLDFEQFKKIVLSIESFWFSIVTLPRID
ncbi:MAG TPA: response regulator [Lentisphaeria bacterium]|nr:MAG: hypothetical protein A2X47_02070 [Lentisphaerae bacterium GWF2_38_69]HBM16776.1 response regulator [Lentisphaeria bacterium]